MQIQESCDSKCHKFLRLLGRLAVILGAQAFN